MIRLVLALLSILLIGCKTGDKMSKLITKAGETELVYAIGFEDDIPLYDINKTYNEGDLVRIGDWVCEMVSVGTPYFEYKDYNADEFILGRYENGDIVKYNDSYFRYNGNSLAINGTLYCVGIPPIIKYPYDLYYYGIRENDNTFIKECECKDYAAGYRIVTTIDENELRITSYKANAGDCGNWTEESTLVETYTTLKYSANGANIGDLVVVEDKLFRINNDITPNNTYFFKKIGLIPVKLYRVNKYKPFDDMNTTKAKFKAGDEIKFKTDSLFNTLFLGNIEFDDGFGKIEIYEDNFFSEKLVATLELNTIDSINEYFKFSKNTKNKIRLKFLNNGEIGTIMLGNIYNFGVADLELEFNPIDYNDYTPNKFGYIEEATKPILSLFKLKLYFEKDKFSDVIRLIKNNKGKFVAFDITEKHPFWGDSVIGCIIVNPTIRPIYKTIKNYKRAEYIECSMSLQEIV